MLALMGPLLGGYFVLVFAMMASVSMTKIFDTATAVNVLWHRCFSVGVGPT